MRPDGLLQLQNSIVAGVAGLLENLNLLSWSTETNTLAEKLLDFLVQRLEGGV